MPSIADNLAQIQQALRQETRLVAVTKTKPTTLLTEAYQAGARLFGENKVQEMVAKYEELPKDIEWHMIGHLQTNKASKAAGLFDAVQSLDSIRLAEALNRAAEAAGRTLPCLVEVKTSPEPEKHGLAPEELDDFLARAAAWPHLKLEGLMTVAPYAPDPAAAPGRTARVRVAISFFNNEADVDRMLAVAAQLAT